MLFRNSDKVFYLIQRGLSEAFYLQQVADGAEMPVLFAVGHNIRCAGVSYAGQGCQQPGFGAVDVYALGQGGGS